MNEWGRESSYIMTVDDSSKRPFLMRRLSLPALLLVVLCGCAGSPISQTGVQSSRPTGMPPWRDTTGVPGVYPFGDAVDVYHSVLDLFFVDGSESPRIIVMH